MSGILKSVISLLTAAVLLASVAIFAFADGVPELVDPPPVPEQPLEPENPDTPDQPEQPIIPEEPVIVELKENFGEIYRYLKLGTLPDLTKGSVDFIYGMDDVVNVPLTNDLIPEDFDVSSVGRKKLTFELDGNEFSLDFIVIDEDKVVTVFKDVTATHWGYEFIRATVGAGFFAGRSADCFGTEENLTRAEFCQLLVTIFKDYDTLEPTREQTFTDLEDGAWYVNAVNTCAAAGVVSGVGDNKFNPQGKITRQDAALMLMKVMLGEDALSQIDPDETIAKARENGIAAVDFEQTADYAKAAVAASAGVIFVGNENGELTPTKTITRVETATVFYSYFFKDYVKPYKAPLVYLSPSNQIHNAYTGVNTTEAIQMQAVGVVVERVLKELGYNVYTAAESTPMKGDGQYLRSDEARDLGAEAYVAIHSNAISGTNKGKYQGATGFYNGQNVGSKELAQYIHDAVAAVTPTTDNGISDDMLTSVPYSEIRRPVMANTIIEVEFHDYKTYAEWITNNIEPLGKAIADGIHNYFISINRAPC